MVLALLVLHTALAGYGDAVDGYPWWVERELHLWTNAVRVDPEAFADDYSAGGCSLDVFTVDERTAKPPLLYSLDLNEAARFHTEDMLSTGVLTHDSSDGTTFQTRIARYYSGFTAGENIAYVPMGDSRFVVASGWMCSPSGHRSAIMLADFEELGTGAITPFYTQDFGGRGAEGRAIAMGVHAPEVPAGTVSMWVDFLGDGAPEVVAVYLDGQPTAMDLAFGVASAGIYTTEIALEGAGCHEYWFAARHGGTETRFPETGSYGWGDCAFDDLDAAWLDRQLEDGELDLPGVDNLTGGCACEAGGAPTSGLLGLGLLVLGLTPRRRSRKG